MSSKTVALQVALCVFAGALLAKAQSQGLEKAGVIVPDTTVEHPEDIGKRSHTNHLILYRPALGGSSPSGETPLSLACVYNTWASTLFSSGCPYNSSSAPNPSGGAGIIAIVDAYDYPTAAQDFVTFSNQFNLPSGNNCNGPCFTKVMPFGKPKGNCGWAQEAALDIDWAHAMAPYAQIYLVEALSNSNTDLYNAVKYAANIVGVKQISMSWGGSEYSGETSADGSVFNSTNVVYFAASGDSGGKTIYPCTSPNVVCVGGTSVNRNSQRLFTNETTWSGSGGGPSKYETEPPYQALNITPQNSPNINLNGMRGAPDFSFDANPSTGVSVYDSTRCQGLSGWLVFGGTSVSSPSLAGIVNWAGSNYTSTSTELSTIYSCYATGSSCYPLNFRDITSGSKAGTFSPQVGWDFITGVGSNLGSVDK
ncbi:MAG: S53 family peptidase [Acidobacteriia bacterium]|nr:S53 family peptidase [Terriglobia bacterium]